MSHVVFKAKTLNISEKKHYHCNQTDFKKYSKFIKYKKPYKSTKPSIENQNNYKKIYSKTEYNNFGSNFNRNYPSYSRTEMFNSLTSRQKYNLTNRNHIHSKSNQIYSYNTADYILMKNNQNKTGILLSPDIKLYNPIMSKCCSCKSKDFIKYSSSNENVLYSYSDKSPINSFATIDLKNSIKTIDTYILNNNTIYSKKQKLKIQGEELEILPSKTPKKVKEKIFYFNNKNSYMQNIGGLQILSLDKPKLFMQYINNIFIEKTNKKDKFELLIRERENYIEKQFSIEIPKAPQIAEIYAQNTTNINIEGMHQLISIWPENVDNLKILRAYTNPYSGVKFKNNHQQSLESVYIKEIKPVFSIERKDFIYKPERKQKFINENNDLNNNIKTEADETLTNKINIETKNENSEENVKSENDIKIVVESLDKNNRNEIKTSPKKNNLDILTKIKEDNEKKSLNIKENHKKYNLDELDQKKEHIDIPAQKNNFKKSKEGKLDLFCNTNHGKSWILEIKNAEILYYPGTKIETIKQKTLKTKWNKNDENQNNIKLFYSTKKNWILIITKEIDLFYEQENNDSTIENSGYTSFSNNDNQIRLIQVNILKAQEEESSISSYDCFQYLKTKNKEYYKKYNEDLLYKDVVYRTKLIKNKNEISSIGKQLNNIVFNNNNFKYEELKKININTLREKIDIESKEELKEKNTMNYMKKNEEKNKEINSKKKRYSLSQNFFVDDKINYHLGNQIGKKEINKNSLIQTKQKGQNNINNEKNIKQVIFINNRLNNIHNKNVLIEIKNSINKNKANQNEGRLKLYIKKKSTDQQINYFSRENLAKNDIYRLEFSKKVQRKNISAEARGIRNILTRPEKPREIKFLREGADFI